MANIGTGLQFWTVPDNDWDYLILDEVVWPGVADVTTGSAERALDLKKAAGSDLSRVVDNGYKNASFSVTLTIWTEEQFRELQERLATIHPRKKGGKRSPLRILHPAINLMGVKDCYVKKVNMPQLDKRDAILRVTIDFLEWVFVPAPVIPPKKGGLTPDEQSALDSLLAINDQLVAMSTVNIAIANTTGGFFPPLS